MGTLTVGHGSSFDFDLDGGETLHDAFSVALDGDTVQLGEALIADHGFHIPAGVTLDGLGPELSRIRWDDVMYGAFTGLLTESGGANVIRNIELTCRGTDNRNGVGMVADNPAGLLVENCLLRGQFDVFQVANSVLSPNVRFRNCVFECDYVDIGLVSGSAPASVRFEACEFLSAPEYTNFFTLSPIGGLHLSCPGCTVEFVSCNIELSKPLASTKEWLTLFTLERQATILIDRCSVSIDSSPVNRRNALLSVSSMILGGLDVLALTVRRSTVTQNAGTAQAYFVYDPGSRGSGEVRLIGNSAIAAYEASDGIALNPGDYDVFLTPDTVGQILRPGRMRTDRVVGATRSRVLSHSQ